MHEPAIKSVRSASQFARAAFICPPVLHCPQLPSVGDEMRLLAFYNFRHQRPLQYSLSSLIVSSSHAVHLHLLQTSTHTHTHTHTKRAIPLSVVHTKHSLSAALHYPSQACYISVSLSLSTFSWSTYISNVCIAVCIAHSQTTFHPLALTMHNNII
jgi:hypothetical protein